MFGLGRERTRADRVDDDHDAAGDGRRRPPACTRSWRSARPGERERLGRERHHVRVTQPRGRHGGRAGRRDAADLFVPLHTWWHPVAVAWGVVALYLLLAVELTSLLQRQLPRRWWRRVHYGSFPLYAFATVHLASAGTDGGTPALQWSAVIATALVVFLALVR